MPTSIYGPPFSNRRKLDLIAPQTFFGLVIPLICKSYFRHTRQKVKSIIIENNWQGNYGKPT